MFFVCQISSLNDVKSIKLIYNDFLLRHSLLPVVLDWMVMVSLLIMKK